MLHIERIVFIDDETGGEISVYLDGRVEANTGMTPDEYCVTSFHAGLMITGGLSEVKKFMTK